MRGLIIIGLFVGAALTAQAGEADSLKHVIEMNQAELKRTTAVSKALREAINRDKAALKELRKADTEEKRRLREEIKQLRKVLKEL